MSSRPRPRSRPKAKITAATIRPIEIEEPLIQEPSIPEPVKEIETIETIFSRIKVKDQQLLSDEQVAQLTELKLANKSPMITLENKYFIYELIAMIIKNSYQTIYSYLQSHPWPNTHDIIFQSPSLQSLKEKTLIDAEIYRRKIGVAKGVHKCGKCGSEETWSTEKQMRSADEPMTITVECVHCGNRWKL